jgi:hypothetical protein
MLQEISRYRPAASAEGARRNIVVHFHNATPHTTRETLGFLRYHRMKTVSQPAFPPDLAPSDFYLFGKSKPR